MALWQVRQNAQLIAQIGGVNALSLCWSPKGKQLVAGCKDGSLVQFDQSLKVKKIIPPPVELRGCIPVSVFWLATRTFVIALSNPSDPDSQPNVVMVNIAKGDAIEYTNYGDVCCGTSSNRPQKYNFHFIEPWQMLVMASNTSPEVAVLSRANANAKSWEIWTLNDDHRAALPLDERNEDTFPVGFSVSYASQRKFTLGEKSFPPCPILMLFSSTGILVSYYLLNQLPDAPQPLTVPPSQPLLAKAVTQPSRVLEVKPVAPAAAELKLTPSISREAKSFPSGRSLFSSSLPRTPDIKLSAKPLVIRERVISPIAPVVVDESPAVVQPIKTTPPAQRITPVVTPKLTPSKFSPRSDKVYRRLIAEEMRSFTEKLNELRTDDVFNLNTSDIGTAEEQQELQKNIEDVTKLTDELKEITIAQSSKLSDLKGDFLSLFAQYDQCKSDCSRNKPTDSHFNRPLDPLWRKAFTELKTRFDKANAKASKFENRLKNQPLSTLYDLGNVYKVIATNYHLIVGFGEKLDHIEKQCQTMDLSRTSFHKSIPRRRHPVDTTKLWRQIETHQVYQVRMNRPIESPLVEQARERIKMLREQIAKDELLVKAVNVTPPSRTRTNLAEKLSRKFTELEVRPQTTEEDLPKTRDILSALSALKAEARKVSPPPPKEETKKTTPVAEDVRKVSPTKELRKVTPPKEEGPKPEPVQQPQPVRRSTSPVFPVRTSPPKSSASSLFTEIKSKPAPASVAVSQASKPGLLGEKPGDAAALDLRKTADVFGGASLFGAKTSTSSIFGNANSSSTGFGAATGSIFSSGNTSGLFGSETPKSAASGGIFGASVAATSASPTVFGTSPSSTATNVFGGSPTSATTPTLFGAVSTQESKPSSNIFGGGTSTTPTFGAVPASGSKPSIFGTAPTFGTAVSTTTPSFGAVPSAGSKPSIFGTASTFGTSPPSSTTSIFGSSPPVSSAASPFGTAASQPTQDTIFGGSGGFLSGLGGTAPSSNATTNIFGKASPAITSGGGASIFGGQGATLGSAATPPKPQEAKPGSIFGAAPSAFGQKPAFGSPSTFGTTFSRPPAPSHIFGASASPDVPAFGAAAAPKFGADENRSPSFGSLAQAAAEPTFKPAFGSDATNQNSFMSHRG